MKNMLCALIAALALVLVGCGSDPAPAQTPDAATDVSVADASNTDVSAEPVDVAPADVAAETAVDVALEAAADVAPADAPDAAPACVDRDSDGYGVGCARGPDCDDTDAQRHPGAVERCNGLDDDCNGAGDDARSDALDAWCTTLWRTAYTRINQDPMRDHAYCYIPPVTVRPGEPICHPTRVACAAMGYNIASSGMPICQCFTASDVVFACP